MDRTEFERLIEMTLADGKLTDQEQKVLIQRASEIGIGPDELQVMLDAKIQEKQISAQKEQQAAQQQQSMNTAFAALVKNSGEKSKDNKVKVYKCPACGAIIDAFTSKCPECGAEISGGSTSGVDIVKFSEMLIGCKDVEERIKVINYTAIPNNKEELVNFLTFAYPKVLDTMRNGEVNVNDRIKERNAWLQKMNEAYVKADVILKGDAKMHDIVLDIKTKMSNAVAVIKRNTSIYLGVKSLFVMLGIIILCSFINSSVGILGILLILIAFVVIKKSIFTKFLQL